MEGNFIPTPLLADAGVPMIVLTLPGMLALLVPIVLIEAWLCRKSLGLTSWVAVRSNAAANLVSTLVGVPVAWGTVLLLDLLVLGTILRIPAVERASDKWNSPLASLVWTLLEPAWLGPDDKNVYWMIPLATIVLLVPTFFISVWIETLIMCRMLGTSEDITSNLAGDRIRVAVRNANLVTYGLLITGSTIWLLVSLATNLR